MSQESFEFHTGPNDAEKEEAVNPLEEAYRAILVKKAEIAQKKADAAEGPITETRYLVRLYDELHDLQRAYLKLEKEQNAKKRLA